MILGNVVIAMYTICTLLTVMHESWNITHPRRNPTQVYAMLNWEEEDFYSIKIHDEWVLRQKRKTDSNLKRKIRNTYWKEKANVLQHK